MSPHADYNGSVAVLIVATFWAAVACILWARIKLKENGLRYREILMSGTPRILFGSSIILFSVCLGRLIWLPYRAMLIAGNRDWQDYWTDVASPISNIFSWCATVGLAIIMLSALMHIFGNRILAIGVVFVSTVIVYYAAAIATMYAANLFVGS